MKLNLSKIVYFICILFVVNFILSYSVCYSKQSTKASLSLPLSIEKGDRIVEFKIKLEGGFVVSVPNIPLGWTFNLNVHQAEAVVESSSTIGVADLMFNEVSFFKDFIVIQYDSLEVEPKIHVEVKVNITENDTEKTFIFDNKQIQIKKL